MNSLESLYVRLIKKCEDVHLKTDGKREHNVGYRIQAWKQTHKNTRHMNTESEDYERGECESEIKPVKSWEVSLRKS
jgi:hypothetical protein